MPVSPPLEPPDDPELVKPGLSDVAVGELEDVAGPVEVPVASDEPVWLQTSLTWKYSLGWS
ncbi:hypothetical protein GQS_08320 [Thermococcus sp. 4557]|nr:hypothetical protein GQS_08320 [Thermococcus sp. 4557]